MAASSKRLAPVTNELQKFCAYAPHFICLEVTPKVHVPVIQGLRPDAREVEYALLKIFLCKNLWKKWCGSKAAIGPFDYHRRQDVSSVSRRRARERFRPL